MKCKICGNELLNGDTYCIICGTPVDYEPDNKKKRSIIAVTVLVVAVLIVVAVVFFGLLMKKDNADVPVSQQEVTSESETASSAEQITFNIINDIELPIYKVGDILEFGSYEQDGNVNNGKEPVEWIVFDVDEPDDYGVNEYRYHLVSRSALDAKPYNNTAGNVRWATSSIRKWLNSDFLNNAFSNDELQSLCVINEDCVRLLSKAYVKQAFPDSESAKATATVYAQMTGAYTENGYCGYWLIDSGDVDNAAARVNIYGEILTSYSESEGGVERTDYSVRPVITIF
ncbi:MAG: zinc ribbon domain-containing protein [Clostridia bacterium]|nr:zinc ribbon domain-containing protein [Clostridia bacterium]